MPLGRVEEARLEAAGTTFLARWDVPRDVLPPLPQAVLVPDPGMKDLHGNGRLPGVRPLMELAVHLNRNGILAFRYAPTDPAVAAFRAAWDRAFRADIASRQRIAAVACGPEACAHVVKALAPGDIHPQGVILIDPPRDLDISSARSIPLVALFAGAGPHRPDSNTAAALASRADASGIEMTTSVIPDLTEHLVSEDDWIAGRAIVHHNLLETCANSLGDLLKPTWERSIRPPGTAIGESAGDTPTT